MIVRVQCPNTACATWLNASIEDVGRRARCPRCSERLIVPTPAGISDVPSTIDPGGAIAAKETGALERLGRYLIRRRLGSGAFGTVYLAHDPMMDRAIALKVPHKGLIETPEAVERFLREARAAARLRHPNIVPAFDVGEENGRYYLASAFVEGRTLAQVIGENGVEPQRAARIIRELADALQHAHDQGIVHRDFKPSNILIDAEDHPHLMDFGLARLTGSDAKLTMVGSILGTPAYMAPEQASGRGPDANALSDQYSLGITLFELLTGQTPFVGPLEVVIFATIHQPIPDPTSINPNAPPELEAICLRMLAKKPAQRFASCREVADALSQWLSVASYLSTVLQDVPSPSIELNIAEPPPSTIIDQGQEEIPDPLPSRWEQLRSRPRILVAVSIVAIVIAAILLGLFSRSQRSAPQVQPKVTIAGGARAKVDGPTSVNQSDRAPGKVEEKTKPETIDRHDDEMVKKTSEPDSPTTKIQEKLTEPGPTFGPMFNGKDLSGWRYSGDRSLLDQIWDDGETKFRSEPRVSKTLRLIKNGIYGDFCLKGKIKLAKGLFRISIRDTDAVKGNFPTVGPVTFGRIEFWKLSDANYIHYTGYNVGWTLPIDDLFKTGDWNEIQIEARQSRILVSLNGRRLLDRSDLKLNTIGSIVFDASSGMEGCDVTIKDFSILRDSLEPFERLAKPIPLSEFETDFLPLYSEGDALAKGWRMVGKGWVNIEPGGILACHGGPGCSVYEQQTFGNFILRANYQVRTKEDVSGISVRMLGKRVEDLLLCHTIRISGDDNAPSDSGSDLGQLLYAQKPLAGSNGIGRPFGEWNTLEITAANKSYAVSINGTNAVSFISSRPSKPGFIGLQCHDPNSTVRFHNIRVKPL